MKVKKRIYLDHAATTYLDPRVKKAMDSFGLVIFAIRVRCILRQGWQKKALDDSRKKIADLIGASPKKLFYRRRDRER